jgi:RNA polymerase sigma factor for flagellar operon FliA
MRARALVLLHAAMSETWEGRSVRADGGVRARNQQRAYLDRVTGRAPASSPVPRPRPAAARTTWPQPAAPSWGSAGWTRPA